MANRKDTNKQSKLLQLYNNKLLRSKVDTMLDENKPFSYILKYLETKGFELSTGSLSNYRKKRIEALQTGVPLMELIDKRKKGSVVYLTSHKDDQEEEESTNIQQVTSSNPNPSRVSDLEFLDEIISKAKNALEGVEFVDSPIALRAIELKDKLTGNSLHGMTIEGIKSLKIKQEAEINALTEVVLSFIPESKHDEVFKALDDARDNFYKNLDLTDNGQKLKKAANDIGLEL